MDMSQYLGIFIEESKEHLQNLNESLLSLEKSPDDMDILNEIFRVAHTLKGIAGTMGFTKMSTLTHDMENVLQTIRSGETSVTSALIDVLFKCLDALENYLNEVISTGSEGENDYKEIIAELNNINKKDNNQAKPEKQEVKKQTQETPKTQENSLGAVLLDGTIIKQLEQQEKVAENTSDGKQNYKVTVKLNSGCLLKSARAFIVFQTIEKNGEILDSNPSMQDIEEERFEFQFTLTISTKETKQKIISDLTKIAEVDEVIIDVFEGKDAMPLVEKIDIVAEPQKKVEETSKNLEVKAESQQPISKVEAQHTPKVVQALNGEANNEEGAKAKQRTGKTVRVDIERLDNLMNLVSELIIIKTTLEDSTNSEKISEYKESIEYLERITTNLHDAVMKVRMVPVENVFNRFPRMIRDLSKELGKEIVLNMSGEETEVDRTVIDELGDPLIHLLRNSADHGIEDPKRRVELGKSEFGVINLRAYHDGNNVVIEVEDDGKGLDIEKIKRKIVEKGLSTIEEVDSMEENEIIQFLFRPSFSTADKVTDVSGRGVGLDVVKTKIEALGGAIVVETELNKGSKFIIRLPLTLAIIQALLVILGNEKYAIPLSSIKEIISITENDIKTVQNQEVYMLRQQVIPVIRLNKLLDVPKKENSNNEDIIIVIVKKGEKFSGFIVDDLMGQQEIVIKSLGKYLRGIKSIAGATILGDGQVALILDVNSLA